MNIEIKENQLLISLDGLVLEIKLNQEIHKIKDLISIAIKADDIVTEVQNEIDMLPTVIISGDYSTGAFYGINELGHKIYIPREVVTFNSKIFDPIEQKVVIPFYTIVNRYSMNSVTKQRYNFARVFHTKEEMMNVYRNTLSYLKMNKYINNETLKE